MMLLELDTDRLARNVAILATFLVLKALPLALHANNQPKNAVGSSSTNHKGYDVHFIMVQIVQAVDTLHPLYQFFSVVLCWAIAPDTNFSMFRLVNAIHARALVVVMFHLDQTQCRARLARSNKTLRHPFPSALFCQAARNDFKAISGETDTILSSAADGPVGVLRRCSQFCRVLVLI